MNLNETISTTEKKLEQENFDRYSGSWINKTEALFTFKRFEESFLMHTKHKTQLFLALFLHLMIIAGFIYMWQKTRYLPYAQDANVMGLFTKFLSGIKMSSTFFSEDTVSKEVLSTMNAAK